MGILDDSMGITLLAVIISAILYGISVVQTYLYYQCYRNDPWYTKLLVAAVMIFDSTHLALITHTIYTYVVTGFGDFPGLSVIVWSMVVEVLFNGLTGLLVQGFYCYRVWRLSRKSIVLTTVVGLLVVAEFVVSVLYTILALRLRTFEDLKELKNLSMSINVVAAVGDVLIALILCVVLRRSKTGFERTDGLISRLVLFTVNTGLLTSICAVASLISIAASPNTLLYVFFYFALGRLYATSLLASLNHREVLRGSIRENTTISLQDRNPSTFQARQTEAISIQIDTTQEYTRDRKVPDLESHSSLHHDHEEKSQSV